jgi:hypothetical protein
MSSRYARLMGDFWRHPRTSALSPAAAGVYCRALSFCADHMSDGAIPVTVVSTFFGGPPDEALIAELVTAKLWRKTRAGFVVRDWEQHNITRDGWEKRKADGRERVAKSRAKKREGNAPVTRYKEEVTPGNSPSLDHDHEYDQEKREPASPARRSLVAFGDEIRAGVAQAFTAMELPAPGETRDLTWDGWARLARWAREFAAMRNRDEVDVAAQTVRAFLGHKRAREKGYPVSFLVQNPLEFWSEVA